MVPNLKRRTSYAALHTTGLTAVLAAPAAWLAAAHWPSVVYHIEPGLVSFAEATAAPVQSLRFE